MSEARKDKRSLLSLKIRYKSATLEDFIEHYSGDISRGGVFIKSKKPLAVGTLLKFEFLLEDQSPLIHGVGRVVWRRESSQSGPGEPPGMGIKFIKMDPQCRSVVQRIVEERSGPGAFDQGEHAPGTSSVPTSLKHTSTHPDQTSVRHVSEFLASAMAEGGAGASTTREAELGAERAREASRSLAEKREAVVRGALRASSLNPEPSSPRVSPGTASSAFGARRGGGLDAQQTLPNGFGSAFDADATIVNQAVDPKLIEELRGALKANPEAHLAQTMPPRATPVVPNGRGLVDASIGTLRPALAPPTPAIAVRGPAPTRPVAAPYAGTADPDAEDQTGPVDLVSLAPSQAAQSLESDETMDANPLSQLHDAPSSPDAEEDLPPVRRKGGRGLAVGLIVLLLAGGAYAAWQKGLFGSVSQTEEHEETDRAAIETASARKTEAAERAEDSEPQDASAEEAAGDPEQERGLAQATAALPYVVELVTSPEGARVTANDGMSVQTPGELRFDSKPSEIKLLIRKPGYRTVREDLDLDAFVTEADRHVLKVEQSLSRRRRAATPAEPAEPTEPAEPAEDSLEQLASAAEKTAAAQATVVESAASEAAAVEDETTPSTAKPEPATKPATKPEPVKAPAAKAEEPPAAPPAQAPAAKAKPETAPASETGAAVAAP